MKVEAMVIYKKKKCQTQKVLHSWAWELYPATKKYLYLNQSTTMLS